MVNWPFEFRRGAECCMGAPRGDGFISGSRGAAGRTAHPSAPVQRGGPAELNQPRQHLPRREATVSAAVQRAGLQLQTCSRHPRKHAQHVGVRVQLQACVAA